MLFSPEMENLKQELKSLNISLEEGAAENLYKYRNLIIEWNKKFNLISKNDEHRIERHILDSLSIYRFINGKSILDLGSGAGFPGIPLGIIDRNISISLLERRKKRAAFLKEVKRQLKLSAISIYPQDTREFRPHRLYDVITARKVTRISPTIRLIAQFLGENGRIILFKGEKLASEIEETKRDIQKYSLSVSRIEKRIFFKGNIVIIDKNKNG